MHVSSFIDQQLRPHLDLDPGKSRTPCEICKKKYTPAPDLHLNFKPEGYVHVSTVLTTVDQSRGKNYSIFVLRSAHWPTAAPMRSINFNWTKIS